MQIIIIVIIYSQIIHVNNYESLRDYEYSVY